MDGVCVKPLTNEEKLNAVSVFVNHPDFSLTYFDDKNVDTHLFLQQPDTIIMTYYRYRVDTNYFEDMKDLGWNPVYYFFIDGPYSGLPAADAKRNFEKEIDWILDPIRTYNIIKARPECQNPAEIKNRIIEAFNTRMATLQPLNDINLLRLYVYLLPLNIILGLAYPPVLPESAIRYAAQYQLIDLSGTMETNGNFIDPSPEILQYLEYMKANLPLLRDNVIKSIEMLE